MKGMLRACIDALFPPRASERVLRTVTEEHLHALLAPCLVETVSPAAVALSRYAEPLIHALVREAKFHRNARAQQLLGVLLSSYLDSFAEEYQALTSGRVVIVPIPLGRTRSKARAQNQVLRIIQEARPSGDYDVRPKLLRRTRETAPQTTLGKAARTENMRGAFAVAGAVDPRDTYLVIDDVVTTGATLQAAVVALRQAGARAIVPLALAH